MIIKIALLIHSVRDRDDQAIEYLLSKSTEVVLGWNKETRSGPASKMAHLQEIEIIQRVDKISMRIGNRAGRIEFPCKAFGDEVLGCWLEFGSVFIAYSEEFEQLLQK